MFKHPLFAVAVVLCGYAFVHQHSPDVWFYRVLSDNMWASGEWTTLRFTPTLLTDFHDHLPWALWPLAIARGIGGEFFEHVVYGGMSLGAFAIALRLARRVGEGDAMWHGLWLLPFSENFMRLQPQGRIDQPFVLAFTCAIASPNALVSAIMTGVALCLRPPFALALFVLVPLGWWAKHERFRWWFFALAVVLPLLSHLCVPDVWPAYLKEQVLASLQGTRSDGDTSHFGTLRAFVRTFWPGLPFLLLALPFVRTRGRVLFAVWLASVLIGLSLGRRHFPHYAWMAYPAALALCGVSLRAIWNAKVQRLAFAGACVFAIVVAVAQRPSTCELVRAGTPDGCIVARMPYEFTDAALLVGHFRRDVRFGGDESGCTVVVHGEPNVGRFEILRALSHTENR